MKLVSVVIPVFNAEKYLVKLLDSIKNQTFKNFEVLVIDDGSTDKSQQICKNFCNKYSNFKYFYKENGGVSSARNLGLQNAKGKYIAFVDSDDFVEKDYLSKMVTAYANNAVELVACGINEINGEIKNQYCYCEDKIFSLTDEKTYIEYFNLYWLPCVWNKLFIKDLIDFEFAEGINYDEDTIFNLKYLQKVKNIYCLKDCLYNYNICLNPNSLTQGGLNNVFEKTKIVFPYRLSLSKTLFKNKAPIYVCVKKMLKAVVQESKFLLKSNVNEEKIIEKIEKYMQDDCVKQAYKYITILNSQDIILKECFKTNNAKLLLDNIKLGKL